MREWGKLQRDLDTTNLFTAEVLGITNDILLPMSSTLFLKI